MTMLQSALDFLSSAMSAFLSAFGVNMSTEQPRHQVIERIGGKIEIRQYRMRVAAVALQKKR
jgi:hypothetical protein